MRRLGPEVGSNQRLFDIVEGGRVERSAAREAGEVVGNLLGSLGESAAQAVEPTHAATLRRWSPSRPTIRAVKSSPRSASILIGAKLSAWPLPPFSTNKRCSDPIRPSSQRVRRFAA